ncbi:hypothetical protein [Hyphomonas sp.]|uniref:hypothetical protein n=1 Tax=Hyphomonas sp. TaxID=87 RepID=UPI00391BB670
MADGTGPSSSEIETAKALPAARAERAKLTPWLFGTRNGLMSLWAVVAAVGLAGLLAINEFVLPVLETDWVRETALIATLLFWAPVLLLLLDPSDNMARGPRLRLPIMSIIILAALAGWAVAAGTITGYSGPPLQETAASQSKLPLFMSLLTLAFLPLIWNASNFARFQQAQMLERRQHANRDEAGEDVAHIVAAARATEAASALTATFVVLIIGGLAIWAGAGLSAEASGTGNESLNLSRTFGLALCGCVAALFAAVVISDHIQDWPIVTRLSRMLNGLSRPAAGLAAFYGSVDSALVYIGAGVVGMYHRTWTGRYFVLCALLGNLAVMGWFLPAPWGLVPLGMAFLLAVSVSRLWSWVEEDRSLAAMTGHSERAPYKIGFREDYRDETLLGFIFIFALAPMAMKQLHVGMFESQLFNVTGSPGFLDWMAFFGVELAKAVPIVDWAEIYGVNSNGLAISMDSAPSRHAVFLARIMVDLVLIAALLQAFSISARNRSQKRLYADRNIDRLDRFVENRELAKAIRQCRQADGSFKVSLLRSPDLVDFRHYNIPRLQVLHSTSTSADVRSFIEALSTDQGRFRLEPAINDVRNLANAGASGREILLAFQRAVEEDTYARELPEGTPGREDRLIDAEDLKDVLTALRARSGIRDLKEMLIDRLAAAASPQKVLEYLSGIVHGPSQDVQIFARERATRRMLDAMEAIRKTGQAGHAAIMDASIISNLSKAAATSSGQLADLINRLIRQLSE